MENYLKFNKALKGRDFKLKSTTPSKRAEVAYREALAKIIKFFVDTLITSIRKKTLTDAAAIDDEDYITSFTEAMSLLASQSIDVIAARIAVSFAYKTHYQNKTQFIRNFKNATDIDMTSIIDKEGLDDVMQKAITRNVNLIKSIKNDFINDIGNVVFGNFKNGFRHEDLIKIIYERGNVTYSRAKLIARDQTSKLNSDLDEERNVKLGLDVYEWGGAGDARERDSHMALNRKLCKYSDPTVYSDDNGKTWKKRKNIGAFIGKPGEDYQCRCVSLAKIGF